MILWGLIWTWAWTVLLLLIAQFTHCLPFLVLPKTLSSQVLILPPHPVITWLLRGFTLDSTYLHIND